MEIPERTVFMMSWETVALYQTAPMFGAVLVYLRLFLRLCILQKRVHL